MSHNHHHGDNSMTGGHDHDHDHDHDTMSGNSGDNCTDHVGHGDHAGHTMKMYFHDGVNEYILFEGLQTKCHKSLIAACFAVFAAAIIYEGLKFFREYLLRRSLTQPGSSYSDDKPTPGSSRELVLQGDSISSRMLSCGHFTQTLLHVIQVFISYCLMLVFMTYNVWLCLALVLGAGAGYFIFGWKRATVVDSNEHCH